MSRRRELLNAIASEDWKAVWNSVTLSDLLFLGERYVTRYKQSPWNSPVDETLREASAHNERIASESARRGAGRRCMGAPIRIWLRSRRSEEYQRRLFPAELAERAAEMKLYLSVLLDKLGLPAAALPALAEPAARIAFRSMHMVDDMTGHRLFRLFGPWTKRRSRPRWQASNETPIGLLTLVLSALPRSRDHAAAQFRSDVRLVEVYTSVFDQKGNHVDGLSRDQFRILDDGAPQSILSFDSESSELTCAVLLDTTGSMQSALPSVKNAVSNLLEQMRESDSVGIFGFSSSLVTLQDFTTDRAFARRAVLRTRAAGESRCSTPSRRGADHRPAQG